MREGVLADIGLLALGLGLLLGGGHALVTGASALARRLGVSPLLIGLTVVAFGTSAPELAVSLDAALAGRGGIAFGNVFGSNLANIGLILGIGALVRPLVIGSGILVREIPLMLLATVAAVVLALDPWLRDAPAVFDRADGVMLLLLFALFLYMAVGDVLRGRADDALVRAAGAPPLLPIPKGERVGRNVVLIVAGLAGLFFGGDLTVDSATSIARALGVTEAVIGLTIVAVGTSLPELVASVIAASRGETDLAVGNVVGSNLFNLLFILGTTAAVAPVPVPAGGVWDLAAVTLITVALLPLAVTHGRRLVRWEGAALLLGWVAYGLWRIMASSGA